MSALLAVRSSGVVHVLSDGSSVSMRTGTLGRVDLKQIINNRIGTLIAGIGQWIPYLRFAELADKHAENFDHLSSIAPELWLDAKAALANSTLPGEGDWKARAYAVLFAGYSREKARPVLNWLQEYSVDDQVFLQDRTFYCGGAAMDLDRIFGGWVKRIAKDPDAFDLHRDGIEIMQDLRRDGLDFQSTRGPAVGGHIDYTRVTRKGFERHRVYNWPDIVGQPIDVSKTGTAVDLVAEIAAWKKFDRRAKMASDLRRAAEQVDPDSRLKMFAIADRLEAQEERRESVD